jgi:beta-galactosidase
MIRLVRPLLAIIIFLAYEQALSQNSNSTRLNTGWEFVRTDLGGIWEAVRESKKGSSEAVPVWTKIDLPHCFNAFDAVDPDVNYYQGPGWYRTMLEVDNPYALGRTLLHFEGAGQKIDVYVYMTKVGSHTGGYDEWSVDITQAIEAFKKTDVCKTQFNGKVPVVIRCDNSRDLEMIPSDLSDFNLYGGIYRYLNLVYMPALSIEKIFASVQVDKDGRQGVIDLRVRFYNPSEINSSDVDIRVFDPGGKVVDQYNTHLNSVPREQNLESITIANPKMWGPSSPFLYTIEVALKTPEGTHTRKERIGFRHFQFMKKGPFFLNGKRLLLRGTHRHEDHVAVGNAMTEDQMRKEMLMIKNMGANFIRLGHYQQSRVILDLCDSLGILVWEEIPWCRGGLGSNSYKDQARSMLTNMIEQHYNHPSVIIWGLGNENDWPGDFPVFDKEKIQQFMTELNDLSHGLDPSRKTAIRRCDFCKDIVDIYSPSIWAGWYRGIYTEYKQVSKEESGKVDHFFHAEWGGDSHARRHSENPDLVLAQVPLGKGADEREGDTSLFGGNTRVSKDGDWSESYIVNLIDWHLKEQETMPWLTGAAYWPFKDFSTPVRPDNPVPYMNQKGVVERDFNKKESYFVFQSYWTEKPMAHIYGHSWPVRWGNTGGKKMIKVYSNCDEAELFVNGNSCGIKKRDSRDFPAAGLRWMIVPNQGKNIVRVVARKEKSEVVDEISFEYQTEKWGEPSKMVLEKINERNDTATVEVRFFDDNDVLCLDAANWVRFSLAGDGKLIDNQGTSMGSRKVQLYNGRAMIKVKTNEGISVVSVQSEGIPTMLINLNSGTTITEEANSSE